MTIHDPSLLDAIEQLGSESLTNVTLWRHMFNDNPPELSNTRGARWNPPGLAAIYTSSERDTAVAEGQHAIDSQPLRPRARRFVYELRASASKALRITPADFDALGLTQQDLDGADFSGCQRIGEHAAFLGFDALIVPSARSDGTNVVIFINELSADAALERAAPPEEIT
ncbi:RES family NAD+ phosphorylase [Gordonia sp. SMJS1]|uniref:RES family NAD+ phosphorylase n=1 Tax=Gordonia sp. SMJS1 TaxID=3039400 RepID=UPI0024547FB5|nr:RES family NAD+ phosphorylase [Gordonia sp. SMJS1]WGJ88047.1 RES family NAD+ phosphorylase [Gordonia sp. SMJS1]